MDTDAERNHVLELQRLADEAIDTGEHMLLAHAIVGGLIGTRIMTLRLDETKWQVDYEHAVMQVYRFVKALYGDDPIERAARSSARSGIIDHAFDWAGRPPSQAL